MELARGTLANVDRQFLSGLDHAETHRLVRLPAFDAVWSAWRRSSVATRSASPWDERSPLSSSTSYGAAAGESSGGNGLRLAHRAEQQTADEARLIARRRDLDTTAERLGRLETYRTSGSRRRALRPAE